MLVTLYSGRSELGENGDLSWFSSSRPDFIVETMDLFIKNGTWPVLGSWRSPVESPMPVYKTQFEYDGPFFEQHADGSIGRRLTDDEASRLRRPKSYSPALVEKAARALQGLVPWLPVFDEMRFDDAG